MALSHAKVADKFVQGDPANGTNLHSRFSDMANFTIARLDDQHNEFHYLGTAVSYSTDVAHRVFNKFTDKHELWITTRRYSQSTDRHLQHLRWAYAQWCEKHGFDAHTVFASPQLVDRTSPNALDTVATLDASLWDVDRPCIRDATRQDVLVSRFTRSITTKRFSLKTATPRSSPRDTAPCSPEPERPRPCCRTGSICPSMRCAPPCGHT